MSDQLEQNVVEEQVEEVVQEQPKESPQQENFRRLKERTERSERVSREAEQRIRELEEYIRRQNEQSAQVSTSSDDDDSSDTDDELYASKGDLKKYHKKTQKEIAAEREKLKKEQEQAQLILAEVRLKQQNPDFDDIVNQDNVSELREKHPILHKSIYSSKDPYEMGLAAYELIKQMKRPGKYDEQDRKIEANKSKPRMGTTNVGGQDPETPLARLNDFDRRILSEEDKERNRQMVARSKSYG